MQYSTLIDRILMGARRMGFTNPDTQAVDAMDCERALVRVLERLVAQHDFAEYIVPETSLATTSEGVATYNLPANFGRFITPLRTRDFRRWNDAVDYGIYLYDGTNRIPLKYRHPTEIMAMGVLSNSRPTFFSRAQSSTTARRITLAPPPDDNNDSNYTVQGTYIEQVAIDELDAIVRLDHPQALEDMALGFMAEDWNHPNVALHSAKGEKARVLIVHAEARRRLEEGRRWR